MKAIFEVYFNSRHMCDKKSLIEDYGGDWNRCIKELYKSDGMGIFDGDPKFIKIKSTK